MSKSKILWLIKLNSAIIILNIVIFSPGLLNVKLVSSSIFETALAITIVIMSIIVFFTGNYKILTSNDKKVISNKLDTYQQYIVQLKENSNKKTFSEDIDIILEQIQRLNKKKETINDILLQKFSSTEMSYTKFQSVLKDIEALFYLNIKSVINKINIFDQREYNKLNKDIRYKKINSDIVREKMDMYNQYIKFIKDSIEDNEEILLKLDKLLLELSSFNSLEDGELENMSAMRDIDDFINQVKLYR